jgi:HPt (histidine-containing phosphotransfer) domain-containing protein
VSAICQGIDYVGSLLEGEWRLSDTRDPDSWEDEKGTGYPCPKDGNVAGEDANPFAHLPVIDEDMRREVEAIIGDAQAYAELIQLFLLEGEERLSEIENAVVLGERATVLRVSHSLKGSCSSIGVIRITEMLAILEVACSVGQWEYGIISRLRTEWNAVRTYLRPFAVQSRAY